MLEAYSVAIRVSLISGVANGLMNISRSFAKAHGDAKAFERQLDLIKLKLVGGAAMAGVGLFGLSLIERTVKPASEYVHQLQQMNIAGMKQAEIARSITAAWDASRTAPTATATQNLAAIRELRMVFGDTQAAIANMPTVQKLQAILANTNDGHGGRLGGESAYTVAKALETKGAVRTPGEFTDQANLMTKAIVASGGKITPQDFLGTFKYGRSATMGWDNAFTYTILPTLIQEMKSSAGTGGAGGPGNALMSVYDKVINGKIAQKDLPIWQQLGLLDASKIVRTKTGATKGVLPEAVRGWDVFQRNPYEWTQAVLMPALRAQGIIDPAKQQMYLARLGGTRTAAFMLQQMGVQGWKFQRDVPLIQGAKGLAAYQELLKNDPLMAQQALAAQWRNLLTVIGYQIMPVVVSGTLKLVGALRGMSQWMLAHPNLTRALVLGFAALSAAMAFGGVVILLSAAFDGLALALRVLGLTPFAAIAGGIKGIANAEMTVMGVTARLGPALAGLATDFALVASSVGSALLILGAAGVVVASNRKRQDVIDNPGAHTPEERAAALADLVKERKIYADRVAHDHGNPIAAGNVRIIDAQIAKLGATASAPSGPSSPYVAPGAAAKTVQVTTHVHMDGKKVATVVSKHMARAVGPTAVGSGRYDPAATLPAAAGGFSR
jgi:hypothetical protein